MYAWDPQARHLAHKLWVSSHFENGTWHLPALLVTDIRLHVCVQEDDEVVKQMPIAHRMWLLYPSMHSEAEKDQQVGSLLSRIRAYICLRSSSRLCCQT